MQSALPVLFAFVSWPFHHAAPATAPQTAPSTIVVLSQGVLDTAPDCYPWDKQFFYLGPDGLFGDFDKSCVEAFQDWRLHTGNPAAMSRI